MGRCAASSTVRSPQAERHQDQHAAGGGQHAQLHAIQAADQIGALQGGPSRPMRVDKAGVNSAFCSETARRIALDASTK